MKEPLGIIYVQRPQPCPVVDVSLALEAGDYPGAVQALLQAVISVMQGERNVPFQRLVEWLNAIPEPWVRHPMLLLLKIWMLYDQHRYTQVHMLLDEIAGDYDHPAQRPDPEEAALWMMRVCMTRGMAYEAEGRMALAKAAYTEAKAYLPVGAAPVSPSPTLDLDPDETRRLTEMDPGGSCALLVDALKLFQAIGDRAGMGRVAHNLGHQYLDRGEPTVARYWLERALELKQHNSGDLPMAYTLASLGICYRQLGLLQEAHGVLDDALSRASRFGSLIIQAHALSSLGDVYRDHDEPERALDLYRRSIALKEQLHDGDGIARTKISLSVLYRRQGHLGLAADAAAEARTLSPGHGDRALHDTATLHEQIAWLLLGDAEAAAGLPQTVERLAARHCLREETLGRWYQAMAGDDGGAAASHLQRAITLATCHRHLHMLAQELPAVARLVSRACRDLSPDMLAGLVQRATPRGLSVLMEQVPGVSRVVAAAGRLGEATSLSVRLLGTFRVFRAGRELDLGSARSQKAVSLFKFLVAQRGKAAVREQILDAIWPEADPDSADRSFEVTLSTLRRLLDPADGPTVIVRRGRGYLLNPEVPVALDVERFKQHLDRGNWWSQRGQASLAVSEWLEAERAYGGDFLADDPYEDWATGDRERLREQYLDMLLRLSDMDLQQGRFGEALERAHRVLQCDPIRESAYRVMMRAHAAQGNRAMVIRDLKRCADVLRHELGEDPMPETRELARRLRIGEALSSF